MRPRATPGGIVCHCLLLETDAGLVLVDSGLGVRDMTDPGARMGPSWRLMRPALAMEETALHQVERLGFGASDVRHIVLTHFDADHTGGLVDFPDVKVHLTAAEAGAASHPRGRLERGRYVTRPSDHGHPVVEHDLSSGERWRGFAATKELSEIAPGIVLISLPGHTRGHAGVAIDAGDYWVLHVGDAFYHRGQVDGTQKAPLTLTTMERLVAFDRSFVKANHTRVSELWSAADPELQLINSHDPTLLEAARDRARVTR
jgi:glyoxylase-like metal-dependent hydrolase (beta-lactamase superfamily II)